MAERTIAILYGGRSGEHEVSLESATSICEHINLEKNAVVLIGIDKDGAWHLQSEAQFSAARERRETLSVDRAGTRVYAVPSDGLYAEGQGKLNVDAVFPVLHGTFGEDGAVQGYLECAHLAYAGSGVAASAIGFDKALVKSLWEQAGLPVIPWVFATVPEEGITDALITTLLERIRAEIGELPVFVKPARGGSSVGVSRAGDRGELVAAVTEAARFDYKLVVEQEAKGREIECAVTGNTDVVAHAIGEVVPKRGFYDYRAKYIDEDGAALIIPAELDSATSERIRELAVLAFRGASCEGLARVDFFVNEGNDSILLNEINTIPGFTQISMFPVLCGEFGLSYPALIDHVLDLALERKARNDRLEFTYESV
ncbi:MAG: D-alanine--D-alanine ligase family protein [Spirochaetia bacterium]